MSLSTVLNNMMPGHLAAVEIFASAARTAAPSPAEVTLRNLTGRALLLFINVSAVTATPALTITIKGKDPLSGEKYTLLASAAYATTGLRVLQVGPDIADVTNLVEQAYLPQEVEISAAHGDSDSITYSVAAVFLP